MPAIEVKTRSHASKNEAKRLRREGFIPFIMYSRQGESTAGFFPKADFDAVIRRIRPGFLPTTIFELKGEDGVVKKAIVKDIQYKATNYAVLHLDFLELIPGQKINVKVPVEYLNMVDCVGVKAGGFLRMPIRHVQVSCLPQDIPTHFELDVLNLDMRQHKRVSDIAFPAGVESRHKTDDIVVTLVKR